PIGMAFMAAGGLSLILLLVMAGTTFLTVMAPIGVYSLGIAFVIPAMLTACMAPFPRIAGAAASLTGFLQMGGGLVGSVVAALFTAPALALAVVIPAMGAVAIVCWLLWRRLPDPMAPPVPVPGGPSRDSEP